MKKRMNFLCVLMLVLMAIQVVMTFVTGADAFAEGYSDGTAALESGSAWSAVLELFESVVVVIAAIASFACFFRFILNVNRNEVFVWDNVLMLRLTGICLMVVVLLISLNELLNGNSFTEVYNDFFDVLIFCMFSLIVAETFAVGLRLKEEQDLTI